MWPDGAQEWVMGNRVFMGTLATAIVLGSVVSAVETAAKPTMISAGHRGELHRATPAFVPRSARGLHTPLRQASGASSSRVTSRPHSSAAALGRHQKRIFGFGLPVTWAGGAVFYGRYYDPSDVVGSLEVPPDTDAPDDPGAN